MDERLVSGKPIALILALLLIGAGLFKWWPSDERAIRRQLDAVADTVTVPSTDTALSKITRLAELKNYFSPDAHVHLGSFDLASRDAVMAAAEQWSPQPGGVYVAFTDEIIEVTGDDAQISLSLKVSSLDPASGERTVDEREANVRMARQNGDWLITSVEPREPSAKARSGTP